MQRLWTSNNHCIVEAERIPMGGNAEPKTLSVLGRILLYLNPKTIWKPSVYFKDKGDIIRFEFWNK